MRGLAIAAVVMVGIAIALFLLVRRAEDGPRASGLGPSQIDATVATPLSGGPRPEARSPDADVLDAARSEREQVVDELRATGSAIEPWVEQGLALLRTIPEAHDPACYVGGCVATLVFVSDAMYRKRRPELEAASSYRAWTGGKRFTVETRADGIVMVSLVLYRPD